MYILHTFNYVCVYVCIKQIIFIVRRWENVRETD